jgi:hypothetical protein
MARPNIQYLDSSMFVQICPECVSRMTIRSIAPGPQDSADDEITYQCVECNKDTARRIARGR